MNPTQPFDRKQVLKKGFTFVKGRAKLQQNPLEKPFLAARIRLTVLQSEQKFNNIRCGKPFRLAIFLCAGMSNNPAQKK